MFAKQVSLLVLAQDVDDCGIIGIDDVVVDDDLVSFNQHWRILTILVLYDLLQFDG